MTYLSTVLADAPQEYWRCADPGGLVLNNIGANVGKIPLLSSQALGMPYSGISSDGGAALALGGLTNIRNGNATWASGTNNVSLELWHWPLANGAYQAIAVTGGGVILGIRFQGTGQYIAYHGGGGVITTVGTYSLSRWHHLVLSYDHVNLRLYVDGAAAGSVGDVFTANQTYGVYLLSDESGGSWGTGGVCEVALYGSTLSAGRALAHFNARENASNALVFQGGGEFASTPGSTTPLFAELDLIYAAVHQAFP